MISKGLNLKVVAEGIETKEALQIFEHEGGDIIQGYYFSPPLKVEKFNTYCVKR